MENLYKEQFRMFALKLHELSEEIMKQSDATPWYRFVRKAQLKTAAYAVHEAAHLGERVWVQLNAADMLNQADGDPSND